MPPLFSQDVWETRTETRCWWRVTTKIWVVFQSGWNFAATNKKHYPDLCGDTSTVWNKLSVWNILLLCKETSGFFRKCWLFSQATWSLNMRLFYHIQFWTWCQYYVVVFWAVCEDLIKLLECAGSVFYQSGLWSWL